MCQIQRSVLEGIREETTEACSYFSAAFHLIGDRIIPWSWDEFLWLYGKVEVKKKGLPLLNILLRNSNIPTHPSEVKLSTIETEAYFLKMLWRRVGGESETLNFGSKQVDEGQISTARSKRSSKRNLRSLIGK